VRISAAGGVGSSSYGAFLPTAATNADAGEALVCWEGQDDVELAPQEREIFCQRLDAATGAELGDDFRVSDMGGLGNDDYEAHEPRLAYNSVDQSYLVVWWGTDDTGDLVAGEREIFGQLLSGAGSEIGGDFRISSVGPAGAVGKAARYPAVAFNATDDEFLVCWEGNPVSLIEIQCQRLDGATGAEVGDDFHVSEVDFDPDSLPSFEAANPAVAWASGPNEYLVVWWGNNETPPLHPFEREIFAQRLAGATGAQVGTNDFRVSEMGSESYSVFNASHPAVAYASITDEYLVCWQADDDIDELVDEELEIFCQRLDAATGAEVGANDFRLSTMGPDGDAYRDATRPRVAYSAASNLFLVVWQAPIDASSFPSFEHEVFARGLEAPTGSALGPDDFRVSDMGPDGNSTYVAHGPAVVATDAGDGDFLVVWQGNDDTGGVAANEIEVYIQRLRVGFLFRDGFDSGDPSAWSAESP
jgi:hypothetical protein